MHKTGFASGLLRNTMKKYFHQSIPPDCMPDLRQHCCSHRGLRCHISLCPCAWRQGELSVVLKTWPCRHKHLGIKPAPTGYVAWQLRQAAHAARLLHPFARACCSSHCMSWVPQPVPRASSLVTRSCTKRCLQSRALIRCASAFSQTSNCQDQREQVPAQAPDGKTPFPHQAIMGCPGQPGQPLQRCCAKIRWHRALHGPCRPVWPSAC